MFIRLIVMLFDQDSRISCHCSENVVNASHLREGLELLDAGFFNDTKVSVMSLLA